MGNNRTVVAELDGLGSRSEQIDKIGMATNATFHDGDGEGLGGLLCKRSAEEAFHRFVRG